MLGKRRKAQRSRSAEDVLAPSGLPQAEQEYLRRINEQVYKRNAELAVKNKTLSLLYDLSNISVQTIQTETLAKQFAASISQTLKLPLVSILLYDSSHKYLVPRAAHSAMYPDESLFTAMDTNDHEDSERVFAIPTSDSVHPCVQVLAHGRRRQVKDFEALVSPFLHKKIVEGLVAGQQIRTTLIFPLRIGKKRFGVLVLSLPREYKNLSTFEQDAITNLVNVLAVGIDKALVYEDLQNANIKLQELDRQKTEFLSIASHQLRTPLSIIKGYIELIHDGAYGKITQKTTKVLDDMDESNERLVHLVDEFLNISRIEQGRTKFSFETSSLNELIQSVVEELTQKALGKSMTIDWTPSSTIDRVYMDEEKIRHVVFNYIDNAIKYSDEGTVTVRVHKQADRVSVTVTDEGLGFGKEDEANFFNKFYRGKNVEGVNVNGTGLGIYVCRKFIEAHDGHVWAHSEGSGKGSEFGFAIPIHKPKKTA